MNKNYKTLFRYFIVLICFVCSSIYCQVEVPLSKRTSYTLRGDFKFVSNTILGKVSKDDGTEVFDPNNSYNQGGLNNQFKMGFIDIDDDPSTFNSSSAALQMSSECGIIKHVGLYWTAAYADKNRKYDMTSVKVKFPNQSSYITLSDAEIIHDYYHDKDAIFKQYACYKDITKEVLRLENPNGMYTVANIAATTTEVNDDKDLGNGLAGGWTMIVIYEDLNLPRKRFYVYDGFVNIDARSKPVNFSFDGFQTIPEGDVNGKIGIISYEGDKGIRGDRFQILSHQSNTYKSITDSSNPMNNFFNANITENGRDILTRVPASLNTLGYDADLFNIKNLRNSIIGNNQTVANFRLMTDNDGYSVTAVAFSIEIYEPAIQMVKRSKHPDDSFIFPNDYLAPGQEINYSLRIYNDGNDDAKDTVIKDQLPENVTFAPKSVVLPSKKVKMDYDKKTKVISFRIPNKMVKIDSDPFEISYNVIVNTDFESLNESGEAFVMDHPVIAEFHGTLNNNKKFSRGFNHMNLCNLPDFYRMKLEVDIEGKHTNKVASVPPLDKKQTNGTIGIRNSQQAGLNKNHTVSDLKPFAPKMKSETPEAKDVAKIPLNKTINELIDLNEIYFEFDKWDITPKAEIELNRIIALMTAQYPKMIIKIETHSDSRGNDSYNLILSQKRAKSIYEYLTDNKICKTRIVSYEGFGESRPLNHCQDGSDCNESEYRLNRRSNFIIMDYGLENKKIGFSY